MLTLSIQPETWAHRVSVGAKLLCLVVLSVCLFWVSNLTVLLFALSLVGILYLSLGAKSALQGARALLPLVWIVGIIGMFHILRGEYYNGGGVVLRILILGALANFVTMTSRLSDMIELVLWLFSPLARLGINTKPIGLAFALVMRFTPILIQRGNALSQAWRARGKSAGSWRIMMPIFISVIDDAEHVSEALRARGGTS